MRARAVQNVNVLEMYILNFSNPKISSTKSVSNFILVVEVRCHKVQGMTEVFLSSIILVSAVSLEKKKQFFCVFAQLYRVSVKASVMPCTL